MSSLVFDGNAHTVTLKDNAGTTVGSWSANNVVSRDRPHQAPHLPFVPNGTHTVATQTHARHHGAAADSANGEYGTHGAVVMNPIQGHTGIAVHSGRATTPDGARRTGVNHATEGCIRTTDEAMQQITRTMHNDPLTTVTVQNNHVQH
jgi:hypothetical protein